MIGINNKVCSIFYVVKVFKQMFVEQLLTLIMNCLNTETYTGSQAAGGINNVV